MKQSVLYLDSFRKERLPPRNKSWKADWVLVAFKRKVASLQEIKDIKKQINEELSDFIYQVKKYLIAWTSTMTDEKHDDFMEACQTIGIIIWDLWFDKKYFWWIYYERNLDKLSDMEKFLKSFLFFLTHPEDKLNIKNMKEYIEILAIKATEDEPEFRFIKEYLDYILDALTNFIEEHKLIIDYSFMDYKK